MRKRLPGVRGFAFISLFLSMMVPPAGAQQAQRKGHAHPARSVRLVAVGDMMMAGPMGALMKRKGYAYPFALLQPTIKRADIAFGNLECCLATTGKPIPKQFTFRGDPRGAKALARVGFDGISLANNHAWDYGREALAETVRHVAAAGVVPIGAGANRTEAHRLHILRRKGLRIGFLAYLGLLPALVPEADGEPCLAMGGDAIIRREVAAARPQVDVLIVSLHAGKEGAPAPTPRQRAFARAAVEAGADLVIGHHPHVVQPLVMYRGKPICYSLGNFVFSTTGRGSGALLEAELFAGGRVSARLLPLRLVGAQPRFAAAMPPPRSRPRSRRPRARQLTGAKRVFD